MVKNVADPWIIYSGVAVSVTCAAAAKLSAASTLSTDTCVDGVNHTADSPTSTAGSRTSPVPASTGASTEADWPFSVV